MKKHIYTLSITTLLLVSCKSVDKMVEQGKYDEAILFSAEKMAGEKDKKTKYVQGIEEAFRKATEKDLARVQYLTSEEREDNWSRIYFTYEKIKNRQDRITPFLPLVSEDGYKAEFQFVHTNARMKEAGDRASAYYYRGAEELMIEARKGDKLAARSAVRKLDKIDHFKSDYKNKKAMTDEGYFLGTTRVLLKMKNDAFVIIPEAFEREVLGISVYDLNSRWTEYFLEDARNVPIDITAELSITHMDVSPESEYVKHYTDSKEIPESRNQTDRNGNVLKDSLGNEIKVFVNKTISAYVTEVQRTKQAMVRGQLLFVDKDTNERINTRPITVEAVFDERFCTYNGDREALSGRTRNRLRSNHAVGFPSDYDLTMEAAVNLKHEMKKQLKSQIL